MVTTVHCGLVAAHAKYTWLNSLASTLYPNSNIICQVSLKQIVSFLRLRWKLLEVLMIRPVGKD